MEFTIEQTQALDLLEDSVTNEVLFGGQAGGGKSILGCYWILKCAYKYPETRWLIGRAVLKTLKETTLVSLFKVIRYQGLKRGYHYKYNSTASVITLNNGSEILLKDLAYEPSDPEFDELGSLELTGAFIDEVNQITAKAKTIVRSRIRHMLDEYGLIPKILMSCNPSKNWVKTEFYTPYSKGLLNVGKKRFVPASVDSNFFISKHYIENLESLDKQTKERLRYGNWDYNDDPNQLMTTEAILNIFSRPLSQPHGDVYITADIARFGKDSTKIRVWKGWHVLEVKTLLKSSISNTALIIEELAAKYAVPKFRILCDEDGIGGGVVDILNCKGFIANATATKGNYANVKAQCAFHLANKVNEGVVHEGVNDYNEILQQELEYIKQKNADKDGKRNIISKEEIKEHLKRSPDDADTYIMRAWFDVVAVKGPSIKNGVIEVDSGISTDVEYRKRSRRTI